MSKILKLGGGGAPFAGYTALTNLLEIEGDLTNGVWVKAGTPTVTTSRVTWTAGTGTDRIRDQWFTVPAGHKMLFVLRAKAVGVNDNSDCYYTRTGIRYYDQSIAQNVNEDRYGVSSATPLLRNDGVFRNYNSQYTAITSGANVMFDLYDHPLNDAAQAFDYQSLGLYDLDGLTGWVQDPNWPQMRWNLDQRIVWWGDSVPAKLVYPISDWLNIVYSYDEAVGGETSAQIRARFEADTSKHSYPTIILSGHNSITSVSAAGIEADIAAMTNALDAVGTDYRVLTLVFNEAWTSGSGSYDKATAVNTWITSTYGNRAIDIYTYLRTKGDGGANDNADVAAGIIPRSLRVDDIHLNGRGQDFTIDYVFQSVDVKGWHG